MATQRSDLEVRVIGRDELSPQFDKLESRLIRFVGAVGAGIAAVRLTAAPITAAANFERELANVRKTTNFLSADMRLLSRELLTLSTRIDVSAVELARIAAAAGQQGLGREGVAGIVQFTESVSRMASVLDITAEQAAEDVGKIANIFKIPLREIESAVSTFNETSNNSTAKGEELLDVVRRIGDAAGTLDLQQSVALAATGLDFGQSPEVVGTAFAKVFSSLVQKQQDFTRLLNTNLGASAENWAEKLRFNGLEAFKDVLAALRTLEPAAQQNTIIKLFGGGRIGALVNKLVQDTANTVLDRNFRSAQQGALGTSALQEQATVLNTLKAQATLTLNALTKAGIEATDQLLGPLTKYVIELREAIQSPSFNSFIQAVGRAVGLTLDLIVGFTKAIASLNVNFGNFVPVVTAFLGLKLAESLTGILARVLGLSDGLKSISTSAGAATKALSGTAAASKAAAAQEVASVATTRAARLAELLGYRELYDAIQANNRARLETVAVANDVAKKQAALAQAQIAREQSGLATRTAIDRVRERSTDVRQSRGAVFKALKDASDQEAGLQAQKAARITAAELQYQQRVAAIEQDYQTRRAAIRATGTEVGLKALRAEKAAALVTEQTSYERSLRGVETYWNRRIAAAAAGAKATVDAERLAYMQSVGRFDQAVSAASGQKERFSTVSSTEAAAVAAAAASSRVADATNKSNVYLRNQNSLVGTLSTVWASATLVLRTAGSVIATMATGLLRLGGILLSGFAWVTVIYSLADAFGLLDRAIPVLRKVTDFLGLTSEAARAAAVEAEEATRRIREQKEEVEALARAYDTATQKGRNVLNTGDVAALVTKTVASDSREVRVDALKEITQLASGALVTLEQEQKSLAAGVGRNVATLEQEVVKAQQRIGQLQIEATSKLGGLTQGTKEYAEAQRQVSAEIGNATRTYSALFTALEQQKARLDSTSVIADNARQNLGLLAKATAEVFTPQSVSLTRQFVLPLIEASEKVKDLEKIYIAAQTADAKLGKGNSDPSPTTTKALEDLQNANREVGILSKQYQGIVNNLLVLPGLPDAVKKSINDTLSFLQLTSRETKALIALADKAGPDALTGAKAGINQTGLPTGDKDFDPKLVGQESAARRLARAQLDLARNKNEAEADLEQEKLRQLQSISDDGYERALTSYRAYFAERERIQLLGVEAEIEQRREDLKSVDFQAGRPDIEPSETVRLEADRVRINGQIAVLQERKKGIQTQTQQDIRAASEAFQKSVVSQFASLSEVGIIPAETIQIFNRQLASLRENAKVELQRLRTGGREDLAGALDNSLSLQAVQSAFRTQTEQFDLAMQRVEAAKRNIQQLREEGSITTTEAETRLAQVITASVPELLALTDAQQQFLDSIDETAVRATPAFQALQQQIIGTRSQLRGLADETAATARQINQNLTTELASILQNMRDSVEGVKDALDSFLKAIGNQVIQQAAKEASENIMKGLGSSGAGGIGGFIAGLFGGPSQGQAPTGTADNPLFTKDAPEDAAIARELVDATKEGSFSVQGMWDGIVSSLQNSDNTFLQGVGQLLSFLGSSFAALISAIFTTSAAESSTEGLSSIATIVQAAYGHTGGVIGSSALVKKFVSPAIFANARRYHSGGIVGLEPNEVPFIGLEGEEVVTEDDPRHRNNLGKGKGGSGGSTVNVWVVTPDQQPAVSPNDIVAVVADNIERRGSIRQLIKRVQIGGA